MSLKLEILKLFNGKIFIILLFSIVALIFTLPIFHNFNYWGIQDWDYSFFNHAVPKATLLEYHQFPLWNPYSYGGIALFADPQSRFLSPSFPLILAFDVIKGNKIEIWLYLVFGLFGVYRLGRHFNLSQAAAILSSFVFMLNSMYALNLTVGMAWFLSIAYLPWVFLFYLKAYHNLRYSLLSGLFLVLMFFGGGPYPFLITISFLILYSFLSICSRKQSLIKVGVLLSIIFLYTLCLGAIKFFPSIEFMQKNPRQMEDFSGFSLNSLHYSLFSRSQRIASINNLPLREGGGLFNGISYHMEENGMYIGVIPFLLFLIGIGSHYKRKWILALCFIVFLWLSFGNRIQLSLWELLHNLPIYNSMRVAQRFRIVFMLCLSIFAGIGIQTIYHFISQKFRSKKMALSITFAILLTVLVDLTIVNTPVFKDAFQIPPIKTEKSDEFRQILNTPHYDKNGWGISGLVNQNWIYSSDGSSYPNFLSNIGVIDATGSMFVPKNATSMYSKLYKGEVYLQGTEGKVAISKWSPNKIILFVDALDEGYVVLNQNYYPGWRIKGNKKHNVESINGLLAVKVSPHLKEVEFYYFPTSFVIGLIVTSITLLLSTILLLKVRFQSSRRI